MRAMFQFKKYILSIIIIAFCAKSYSKSVDSLIFSNDFERKIFTKYCSGEKVDPIDILISIDYTSKSELIKVKLTIFFESLEKSGFKQLSKKKQIKDIYKKVHSTFLQKYTEEVVFSDIFINGNYNCVTASSLYALVFDHFNIDFQIKKTPVHVYLIADPKGEQIAIETTLPNKGLVVYDDRLKKGFVEYLKDNKLISENEYRTNTIDALFEKNYTKAATINLTELTSLQYYNNGITLYQAEKYEDAANSFEKARILYSESTIKFMQSNSLVSLLSEQNRTKKYNGITLAKYINENKKSATSLEYTNDYFSNVSRELVINHPNISVYNTYYSEFINNLSDSIDRKEFNQLYSDLLGYYYYTTSEFKKAIKHFGDSYKLNPENIQTKQALQDLILKSISSDKLSENRVDTLIKYIQVFPFILNNTNIQQMVGYVFVGAFDEILNGSRLANERVYLDKIYNSILNSKLNETNPDIVSYIYSQMASTYYRYHFYESQEDVLKKGLELVPNSATLASNLRIFQATKNELMEWARTNKVSTKPKPYSLDNESLSALKIIGNRNRSTINSNIDKFLKNSKFLLESMVIGNKINKLPTNEQVTFTFEKDGVASIYADKEVIKGTWVYDVKTSTIKLYDNKDKVNTYLEIYEFDGEILKVIMYIEGQSEKLISILKRY